MTVLIRDTSCRLAVRPNDFDSLGHVNNSVALEYLEAARWHWLAENGVARGDRVIAVVARAEVDYLREIATTSVDVITTLAEPDSAEVDPDDLTYRVEFAQEIRVSASADVAVRGRIVVGFLAVADRRLATLQEFLAGSAVEPVTV